MKNYVLKDNTALRRYEFEVDGPPPLIDYIINNQGTIFLTHTEVPPALQGKGVGQELVRQILADVERRGLKVVPSCPFVASYMKRHPETMHLLMPGLTIAGGRG
jgi:predicted GNAT family acetyltransferase